MSRLRPSNTSDGRPLLLFKPAGHSDSPLAYKMDSFLSELRLPSLQLIALDEIPQPGEGDVRVARFEQPGFTGLAR